MPTIPINRVGEFGLVRDIAPHELPLNAWSAMTNMRARDGNMVRFSGHAVVFSESALPIAPYRVMYAPAGIQSLWVYAGLSAIYGTTGGGAGTDLSGATYNATADKNWTGGVIGEVAILNNAVDPPQFWLPESAMATNFANLTNWPASTTCAAMRVFKQYLIALDITKISTRYPHMVKWSHPADPRQVPSSWDETDATKDAGEYTLSETPGFVVDCAPLGDLNIVYKEDSIWTMQFVGGIFIFRFAKAFDGLGIQGRRAITNIPGRQVAFVGDDIIVHDGRTYSSILTNRDKQWLKANINSSYLGRAVVATDWAANEVWVGLVAGAPASGSEFPNVAYVWNFKDNTVTLRDLPYASHMEAAKMDVEIGSTWATTTKTWATANKTWADAASGGIYEQLLLVSPPNNAIYHADRTLAFNAGDFNSSLERIGMGIPFEAGAPPDLTRTKVLKEVWPRITGMEGNTINIYVTAQREIGSNYTWQGPFPFVIGQSRKINPLVSGKLLGIKYEATGQFHWELHGHEFNIEPGGKY